ncbi:MAG: hypothetical protein U1G05_10220 [Kiritimatiellia bacterium]
MTPVRVIMIEDNESYAGLLVKYFARPGPRRRLRRRVSHRGRRPAEQREGPG